MRATMTVALIAAGAIVAACAPKQASVSPSVYDRTVNAECYTVDLFTPATVSQPSSDVPAKWAQYLGKWGGAAWEGQWCHDLYVLSISSDGKVDVISAHAPFPEWGREATAFRRQGYMTKNDTLRLLYKNVTVEYQLVNGRLLGLRKEGPGEMRIKMSKEALAS